MLELKNITKDYVSGEETVHALKGVSLSFRENEFVSILGQSGCGKTTLLNIIGGLDRYTTGDLVINGRSTKEYKDRDWDTYRNHSIGFVFQSYNLIPHQSVLSNVELALTLTGVPKVERRRRAKEALEKVGLGDQLRKKPNQMSGGQMQRVAIARALVNNPDILLADEPTGALDSETSLQVMEILKEVAKDKLVIMVTHNPELAEKYSTRIIRLLDGEVISDTSPAQIEEREPAQTGLKKPSMSFFTGFMLSLNNLMTKKGRTILTAFAGSIGIIGIALIMSLSNGLQTYIDNMEEDTLTSYPITIEQASMDMTSMMTSMMSVGIEEHEPGQIYSGNIMTNILDSVFNQITANDLKGFRAYLEEGNHEINQYISEISYSYATQVGIYTMADAGHVQQVNPSSVLDDIGLTDMLMMAGMGDIGSNQMMAMTLDICKELLADREMLESDYELLAGQWPENYNEVVLVVTENYEVSDYTLYALGLLDTDELEQAVLDVQTELIENGDVEVNIKLDDARKDYSYEEMMARELKLVLPTDYYQLDENGVYVDMREDEDYMEQLVSDAEQLKIVGVLRSTTQNTMDYGFIGYLPSLTEYVITSVEGSEIVRAQKVDPDTDVFTGLPFPGTDAAIAIEEAEAAAKAEAAAAAEATGIETGPTEAQLNLIEEKAAAIPEAFRSQLTALSVEEQVAAMVENGLMTQEEYDALGASAEAAPAAGLSEDQIALIEARKSVIPEAMLSQLELLSEEEQAAAMIEYGLMTQEEFDALAAHAAEDEVSEPVKKPEKKISDSSYETNMNLMYAVSLDTPSHISLYCDSFEDKEALIEALDAYNDELTAQGRDDKVIRYADYVGMLMSSVTDIVNVVSYILIAFVGISLVVSSIMIGVITLISVQERTKEIGILRSVGASKKDVSRVFNAETLIIGLASGVIGIVTTLLLNIPINAIVLHLTGIDDVAVLPTNGAIGLVIISVLLTIIAGLIPSKAAAKKDPVVALRTE